MVDVSTGFARHLANPRFAYQTPAPPCPTQSRFFAAERSRGNGQLAFPQLTARVPQIASLHEEALAASLHHVFGVEIIHASATTGQDRTP